MLARERLIERGAEHRARRYAAKRRPM